MRAILSKLTPLMAALALAGCSFISPTVQTPTPGLENTATPLASPTQPVPAATQTPIIIVVTATPEIQATATLEATAVIVPPTETSPAGDEAAPLPVDAPVYVPQPGTPARVQNFARPNEGCNLTAVAGQVFDAAGSPQLNIVVQVGGMLDNRPVNGLSLTGAAPAYGPGGFEVVLSSEALESAQTLWLQLVDLQGQPLSAPIPFDTEDDCLRNVVLINFVPAG